MRSTKVRKTSTPLTGKATPQRIFITLVAAACVGVAWWVLFGQALRSVDARFELHWRPGDEARRLSLGIALTIYFVRLLFTQFVFLKRAVSWEPGVGHWPVDPNNLSGARIRGRHESRSIFSSERRRLRPFRVGLVDKLLCRVRSSCMQRAPRKSGASLYGGFVSIFAASQLFGRSDLLLGVMHIGGALAILRSSIDHVCWIPVRQHSHA